VTPKIIGFSTCGRMEPRAAGVTMSGRWPFGCEPAIGALHAVGHAGIVYQDLSSRSNLAQENVATLRDQISELRHA